MEQKKTPQADLEQQRTTGFLLGVILVLALLFVALEWNDIPSDDDDATLDLDELVREDEMIPMSLEEQLAQLEPDKSEPKEAEQLHIVDDNVEILPQDEQIAEDEGDGEDEALLKELQEEEEPKALAPMGYRPRRQSLAVPSRRRPSSISWRCRGVYEVVDQESAIS
jgi:hypothetical protein